MEVDTMKNTQSNTAPAAKMLKQPAKKAMTPKQAAQIYGVSEAALANMRYQKTGPKYFKVGKRKVIYFIDDFEAWLRKRPVLTIDSIPE